MSDVAKILGVETFGKNNEYTSLAVSITKTYNIFLNEDTKPFIPLYEKLAGQEVSFETQWRYREGRYEPSLIDPRPRKVEAFFDFDPSKDVPASVSDLGKSDLSKVDVSKPEVKTAWNNPVKTGT